MCGGVGDISSLHCSQDGSSSSALFLSFPSSFPPDPQSSRCPSVVTKSTTTRVSMGATVPRPPRCVTASLGLRVTGDYSVSFSWMRFNFIVIILVHCHVIPRIYTHTEIFPSAFVCQVRTRPRRVYIQPLLEWRLLP